MSVAGFTEAERLHDLERGKRDLYWLCSEVLEYEWNPQLKKGMVEHFHKPLCTWWSGHEKETDVGVFLERGGLKTTIFTIGDILQQFLIDPNIAIQVIHAVEDKAFEIVDEVRNKIATNKRYRAMLGQYAPSPQSKSWYKAERLILNRTRYQRSPSLRGAGVNTEITGAHVQRFYLDDVIARSTIENSQIPKVKSWLQNTLESVLDPGGKLRVVGTRWDIDDPYQIMIDDRHFKTLVVPCKTSDGTIYGEMDYKGKPVYYGPSKGDYDDKIKRLRRLERKMLADFAPQMMNDPSPAGEKPWVPSTCEHYITLKEAAGTGTVFVLSDPAPAKTGSFGGQKELERKDGTKDYWATCVVKIRAHGQRQEVILLDGSFSQSWSKDDGWEEVCRLAKKWNTPFMCFEGTGQAIALYEEDLRLTARRMGVGYNPLKLKNTYKGKNQYFASLASKAERDEFLMCETVPDEFREEFLKQARNWRPIGTGKNALKFDDVANCVSFATDPGLREWSPTIDVKDPWSGIEDEEYDNAPAMTRYCGI